jgi:hypothetical protein
VQVTLIIHQDYLLERLLYDIVCNLVFDYGGRLAVGHLRVVNALGQKLVHVVLVKLGFALVRYADLEGLVIVFVFT